MATYFYKARNSAGEAVNGLMDAPSQENLVDQLHKMGYMPTKVKESFAGVEVESLFSRFQTISVNDMVMFNIQLSNMISAGITILNSLHVLSKQIENKKLKEILGSIARRVEAGDSLSQSLKQYSSVFSSLFINMIKAGEASGRLDVVLKRYADYYEKQENMQQKVKSALLYPMILMAAGIAVTMFMVTVVIPQFAEIFNKVGLDLPGITLVLYKTGLVIKQFWYLIILFFAFCWMAIGYYKNTVSGKRNFDKLKLKIPLLGVIYRKSAISRFARTLATLIDTGVPILDSLEITKNVLGNEVLGDIVEIAHNDVEEGKRLSDSLKGSTEFPSDIIQMIAIGEESGSLPEMLNKIADFYDMYLDRAVNSLTAMIEPLFLAILGGLVGFIMISILTPMFDMVKVLRH